MLSNIESIHESCMIFIRKFWKICDAFFPFSISGWMCFSSDMFFPKDALYESRDHGEAIEKRPKHSDWQKCSNEVDKVGNLLEKAIYLLNHKFPLPKQNFQLYLLRLVTSNNQNTLVFFLWLPLGLYFHINRLL